jgi:hypothetical protein
LKIAPVMGDVVGEVEVSVDAASVVVHDLAAGGLAGCGYKCNVESNKG